MSTELTIAIIVGLSVLYAVLLFGMWCLMVVSSDADRGSDEAFRARTEEEEPRRAA